MKYTSGGTPISWGRILSLVAAALTDWFLDQAVVAIDDDDDDLLYIVRAIRHLIMRHLQPICYVLSTYLCCTQPDSSLILSPRLQPKSKVFLA